MEEDRAAPPTDARAKVPIEYADHVVKTVVAPHGLVARRGGKPDRAVVSAVARVFAPAVVRAHGLREKRRTRAGKAIAPHDQPFEAEPAGRRRAVAFPFQVGDSASAKCARELQGAAAQQAAMALARR